MQLKQVRFSNTDPDVSLAVRSALSPEAPVVGFLKYGDCGGTFYVYATGTDNQNRPMGTDGYYQIYNPSKYHLGQQSYVRIINNRYIDSITDTTSEELEESKQPTVSKPTISPLISDKLPNPDEQIQELIETETQAWEEPATVLNQDYTQEEKDALRSVDRNFNRGSTSADYDAIRINNLASFDRFKIGTPDQKLVKAFPKIFFTRPDLNFFGSRMSRSSSLRASLPDQLGDPSVGEEDDTSNKVANDVWYKHTYETDPHLLASLTSRYTNKHIFNPFLSNMASSFDVSDEKLESDEHGQTFTGWKIKYGRHNIGTKSAGSFSVSYDETNRLEVYKIHKAWVDYIAKVYRGEFIPKEKYIQERRLDYACSVYYFLCAEDGETILFWSKYVGVFPTSIPTAQFAWSKNDIIRHTEPTVEYDYAWKEDCDYGSLQDFNYNPWDTITNIEDKSIQLPVYDAELGHVGFTYANRPIVVFDETDNDGKQVIKLKYIGQPDW